MSIILLVGGGHGLLQLGALNKGVPELGKLELSQDQFHRQETSSCHAAPWNPQSIALVFVFTKKCSETAETRLLTRSWNNFAGFEMGVLCTGCLLKVRLRKD